MNRSHPISRRLGVALALALAGLAAQAAPATNAMTATYERDRAACLNGSSHQERSACLNEARSVLRDSRAGGIPSASPQTQAANAMLRCQVQPEGGDRSDCEHMVRGEGQVSGSAAEGGQLKSITTYSVEPLATPR